MEFSGSHLFFDPASRPRFGLVTSPQFKCKFLSSASRNWYSDFESPENLFFINMPKGILMQVVCGCPLSDVEAALLLEAMFQLYLTLDFVHHVSLSCICVCAQLLSCVWLCMDCSPPDSSICEYFRKEYWSGLPFPSPGNLLNPGIEPESLVSPALAGRFFYP